MVTSETTFPLNISEAILITCFFDLQIVTPFPAANPSALTTTGNLLLRRKIFTCSMFCLFFCNETATSESYARAQGECRESAGIVQG